MQNAYNLAAVAVLERLDRINELNRLKSVRRKHVSVFTGQYDHVQRILDLVKIPYRMDPQPDQLKQSRVVFANCTGQIRERYTGPLQSFVSHGGLRFSTDWCLKSVIERCFANTIRRKLGRHSSDEVIGIEAANDSLWADVVVPGCEPQWWIEGSSYPIEILDDELVKVEAASHELLVRYDAPVVAASFSWGKGRVHHVMSHFWMRRSRTPAKPKYQAACTEFLKEGMGFSEKDCTKLLQRAGLQKASDVNFAQLQTAVTSTELVVKSVLQQTDTAVPRPGVVQQTLKVLERLIN